MIKIYQDKVVKYNDAGEMIERGNCFAACIASVMELPLNHVPNIEELFFIQGDYWQEVLQTWLTAKGWEWNYVKEDYIIKLPKDQFYFVVGKSPRGSFNHIVVYQNGKLVHDPYPGANGIEGEPLYFEVLEKL